MPLPPMATGPTGPDAVPPPTPGTPGHGTEPQRGPAVPKGTPLPHPPHQTGGAGRRRQPPRDIRRMRPLAANPCPAPLKGNRGIDEPNQGAPCSSGHPSLYPSLPVRTLPRGPDVPKGNPASQATTGGTQGDLTPPSESPRPSTAYPHTARGNRLSPSLHLEGDAMRTRPETLPHTCPHKPSTATPHKSRPILQGRHQYHRARQTAPGDETPGTARR